MKTIKNISLFLMLMASLTFIACGGDDDVGGVVCSANFNFQTELQAELTAVTDAALAYGLNPTTENCNAFKAASEAYINAAAEFEECADAAGQGTEFDQSIADAQAEIDALQC